MKPGFERVANLPPGDIMVSLLWSTRGRCTLYAATQRQVFYLVDGALAPLDFILQKEGLAEASPGGVQPPEEKQPPGNTGA